MWWTARWTWSPRRLTAAAGGGNDTVQSSPPNYTLGANVENLELTGAGNLNGTGNAFANALTGNSGNNQLSGGLGEDTVNGGAGDDRITMLVTAGNVDTLMPGRAPTRWSSVGSSRATMW